MEPLTVGIDETKRLTGLSRPTIYRLIGRGQLDARKIGTRRLITVESIRALVGATPQREAA